MKLAFTTLGCPSWNLDTIIARAVEYGYDGVDFRGYGEELAIYKLPEFSTRATETARRFRDAGLAVSCFSSSAKLHSNPEEALEEVRRYAPLCRIFGTPQIRVFGGKIGDVAREKAVQACAETFRQAAQIAAQYDVTLVIETHDDWMDCHLMRSLMESVSDLKNVGVLWDVHHPWRVLGEAPATTWEDIGRWVKNTHVKDSRPVSGSQGDFRYVLPGAGDVPLAKIVRILKQAGYNGYLTFEWEKRWHPELPEPEIAFPRYVEVMKKLLQ